MNLTSLISQRSSAINGSGIRRVFDEAAATPGAIKLFIGQPDFAVDEKIRKAAIDAINTPPGGVNPNGYSLTQGSMHLQKAIHDHVAWDLGWKLDNQHAECLVTTGTSGALMLAALALLNPGDEIIIPDPYFVLYPYLAHFCQAKAIKCDTYPDFRMTAARVAPLITERTKAVLVCSPGNPSGVVLSQSEQRDLLNLCKSKGVLLISDEIYDDFTFSDSLTAPSAGEPRKMRCPSAAREPGAHESMLVIRGFGKTYGVTGWRLGYAIGPTAIVREMRKLQQYVFVCAPTPLQFGVAEAFKVDMSAPIKEYQSRRDEVLAKLSPYTEVALPGGAFYAFVKVPAKLNMTGEEFYQKAKSHKVFVVPGHVFSQRDTHFRLSFAASRSDLTQGLEILARLMQG
jgi:aspartate/methionine/tyrosine aminotransferase